MTTYALKFTRAGGIGAYSDFAWPVPNGKPGTWVGAKGKLEACVNGIHAATWDQAVEWLNDECYVIELGGRVIDAGDKLVARKGRLVRRVEGWDDKAQRLFAADCAEHVLPIFERERPNDDRPRKAIEAARAYARGEIDAAAWAAAWDAAARDAAGAAAGAAAWAAAGAAAWDAAARDAAGAAAGAAARDAARAAAGAAAWDAAARDAEAKWQTQALRRYIDAPEVP